MSRSRTVTSAGSRAMPVRRRECPEVDASLDLWESAQRYSFTYCATQELTFLQVKLPMERDGQVIRIEVLEIAEQPPASPPVRTEPTAKVSS